MLDLIRQLRLRLILFVVRRRAGVLLRIYREGEIDWPFYRSLELAMVSEIQLIFAAYFRLLFSMLASSTWSIKRYWIQRIITLRKINVSSVREQDFRGLCVPAYALRLPILFLAWSSCRSTRGWPQHVLRNLRNALNGKAGFFRVPLRFYRATTCAISPYPIPRYR
jgi:hypothetical protein